MKVLSNYRKATDVVPFVGAHQIPHGGSKPTYTDQAVRIADDLWIGPLGELKKSVLLASIAPGENWHPHRIYRCHYAIWRTSPPTTPVNGVVWDGDRRLQRCIQVLRLVRPTTLAYRYACRVHHNADRERIIEPAGIVGHHAHAFLTPGYKDGVQPEDIPAWRKLLRKYDPNVLPNRVKNALWMHEHVSMTHLMNIRWPVLITALEALVHTHDRGRGNGMVMGSTEQFALRLSKLADLLKCTLWSEADLRDIYDLRSAFAHGRGGPVDALNGEPLRLYELASDGLSYILKRCILQPDVADIFAGDASIRTCLHF